MYWNSVSTFGALLQFQYHSCEDIVYFSRDFSTTIIHYIQHTEVTANQMNSFRCFHCARLKSMYWNTVSTFVALFQFHYHSCEDIVYFSRDFSATFIQYIQHTEVTANQRKSNRCFHCARLKSMYWNSVSTYGALLQFQYHSCEEIVYFSKDFSTTFIQYIQHIPKSRRTRWIHTDALIVQDSNGCTEIQNQLLGHIFTFSTTAVKR